MELGDFVSLFLYLLLFYYYVVTTVICEIVMGRMWLASNAAMDGIRSGPIFSDPIHSGYIIGVGLGREEKAGLQR